MRKMIPTALGALLISVAALGQQPQQTTNLPDAPSATTGAQAEPESPPAKPSFRHRIFSARGLAVTNNLEAKPFTTRDKFHLFVRQSTDPGQFILVAADAGFSQALNNFEQYGQGAQGYGKRYGASLADNVSGEFFRTFLFPTLLHEDPRYFRKGSGPFRDRLRWALRQSFMTRTDTGGWRFGYSRVFGNVAAGTLSNAYYPDRERGVGLTAERSAIITGFGIATTLGQEFGPDLLKKFFGKKKVAATPKPRASSR